MNETQFKQKVEHFLKNEGYWYIKYWGGGGFTKSGIPDILACIKGYFFGLELKVHPNKPSELQMYHIRKIQEAGGNAIVMYPEDFEAFKDFCNSLVKTEQNVPIDINQTLKERKKENAKENRNKGDIERSHRRKRSCTDQGNGSKAGSEG